MKWWVLLILFGLLFVYIIIGGVIFMVLESQDESDGSSTNETQNALDSVKQSYLDDHTCLSSDDFEELIDDLYEAFKSGSMPGNVTSIQDDSGTTWTLHTSIYFAVTVVTTIGYGNISPSTPGGRVFCVFFAIIGIPLTLIVLAQIGFTITKAYMCLDKCLQKRMSCCKICTKAPRAMSVCRLLTLHILMSGLFLLIPSAIFAQQEHNWSYGDGFYYSFVTLTTIGFGDYVAGFDSADGTNKAVYRILVALWIFIGLAWMASVISQIQVMLAEKASQIEDKAVVIHNEVKTHTIDKVIDQVKDLAIVQEVQQHTKNIKIVNQIQGEIEDTLDEYWNNLDEDSMNSDNADKEKKQAENNNKDVESL